MQESELGEIPEGWDIVSLEKLCVTITKGTTPKKSDISNAVDAADITYIKVKDISNSGEVIHQGLESIPRSIHESILKRSILKSGDLLFSIAGTIGRVAIVDETLNNSNTNQAVGIIRLKEKDLLLPLVWQALTSDHTQIDVQSKVIQGVQANVSLRSLRDIKIIRPCSHITKLTSVHLNGLLELINRNRSQSLTLRAARDLLLPKLLSGELSVADAETQLAEAEEAAHV